MDKHLGFKKHRENSFWNANYKVYGHRCIRKYLTIEKAKLLGNALLDSQFSYMSLIWMSCQKTLYFKIKKKRKSNVFYRDCQNSDTIPLSIHQENLQFSLT